MFGLDELIAEMADGESFAVVVAIAILLGLRHATDPDHLTAVSTLVASEEPGSARRASLLGLSWGIGHGTTLFLFGLPIVLFQSYLPKLAQQGAEVLIGFVIIGLAVRLLVRWRRGEFHAHAHSHGGRVHRHLHGHAGGPAGHHDHSHDLAPGRTTLQAYAIGALHGIGGSAGVGILLLAAIPDRKEGAIALAAFAIFTAASMAIASTVFGLALSRGPVLRRLAALAPALGGVSLAFGVWYALGALGAVPYAF